MKKQNGHHRFFLNITRDLGTYPISVNPLPLILNTPSRDRPVLCPNLSKVASPSDCGPPCGGIHPKHSQYGFSWTTSTTRKAWATEQPPSEYGSRSGHLHPSCSTFWSATPTFAILSEGCWTSMAIHRPPTREISQDTWRRWTGKGISHKLWSPNMSLPVPHPPPGDITSFPLPFSKKPLRCDRRWLILWSRSSSKW